MDIATVLTLIWMVVAICVFAAFVVSGRDKFNIRLWEFIIIAFILSALWPAELCIAMVMLPFYPIHLIRQRIIKKKKPICADDDEELDPLMIAEEHPDWTDGTTEYED